MPTSCGSLLGWRGFGIVSAAWDKVARAAAIVAASCALAACGKTGDVPAPARTIGLSTSLPLIWGESGDIRGQLADPTPRHWAMSMLERRGRVVPLDMLAGPTGLALPQDGLLVLAQPRPLSPEENVALDAWVRRGGRLLLFADPMLTAESVYAIGDPRRPETIAMLSPILHHWGLETEFDDRQAGGERRVTPFGIALPVDLPGRFRVAAPVACRVEAEGIAADCAVGKGRVIALADAALFDGEDAGRSGALSALLDRVTR